MPRVFTLACSFGCCRRCCCCWCVRRCRWWCGCSVRHFVGVYFDGEKCQKMFSGSPGFIVFDLVEFYPSAAMLLPGDSAHVYTHVYLFVWLSQLVGLQPLTAFALRTLLRVRHTSRYHPAPLFLLSYLFQFYIISHPLVCFTSSHPVFSFSQSLLCRSLVCSPGF